MIDKKTEDEIGIIMLENPPQNYLQEPEFIPVSELKGWIEENGLKGLIISGSGRHFSGGAKIESLFAMADGNGLMEEQMQKGKELLDFLEDLDIPVVAAIRGICFGGGLEIALACHIRICSENALFAFPETNLGLMPGLGGTYRLGEKLPLEGSLKLILGGDMINAEEAMVMKLVDRIVRDDDPLSWSFHYLKRITEGRPLRIINYIMRSLKNVKKMSPAEAMKEETRMFCDLARRESERRKMNEE
jgi:enoyl-CoA hydratase/carnithine racemase